MMQGPWNDEAALRGLEGYEQMVNTFAQNAKAYWRFWGPMGAPMVQSIEAWEQMQRAYIRWVREVSRVGGS